MEATMAYMTYRWLLEKEGRSSWYSYYADVVADAVRDGWTATKEEYHYD